MLVVETTLIETIYLRLLISRECFSNGHFSEKKCINECVIGFHAMLILFQILSQNFDWFTETFEKMPKDGRELLWRQLAEHETPELLPLPDNIDERCFYINFVKYVNPII